MTTLIDDLVPDELWTLVEPLLPVPPRPRYGGRHRVIPDRNCFAAIVYMARTSTPWRAAARPGARLRLAGDVLASVDRVGQGRGVRCPPPQGLGPAWCGGSAGLVTGERGFGQCARQARGTTWAQIRSIVASLEASSTWPATAVGFRWPP